MDELWLREHQEIEDEKRLEFQKLRRQANLPPLFLYDVFDSRDNSAAYSVVIKTLEGWKAIANFPISLQSDSGSPFYDARIDAQILALDLEKINTSALEG